MLDRGRGAALALATLCGLSACETSSAAPAGAREDRAFVAGNLDWRERRLQRLTEPYGYLSLIDLVMLAPEASLRIGAADDNDVVVPRGPSRWGTLHVGADGSEARFEVAHPGAVRIDGNAIRSAVLRIDADPPTQVEADGIRMHLVDPGGRLALRIRDPQAPTRLNFAGLEYFELDRSWRVEAQWVPNPPGTTIEVANVLGQLIDEPNPGYARFTRNGRTFSLQAVDSGDDLFYIFADRTSGDETYGPGRFLYSGLPADGRVTLDFNRAYNPPCAFNAHTTCPLPPPGNRLDAAVRAGERKYAADGVPAAEH